MRHSGARVSITYRSGQPSMAGLLTRYMAAAERVGLRLDAFSGGELIGRRIPSFACLQPPAALLDLTASPRNADPAGDRMP